MDLSEAQKGIATDWTQFLALLHRDADWHRAHAVDEVRVRAARRRQHLDDGMARQQFLPQDAQLQFGEPVADAAMDAETE